MSQQHFFTVSQLNTIIKDVINAGFPYPVWVCGEVQNYDRNKNKNHIFFELCEKDPKSKDILARIGLVIFANRKNTIDQILKNAENGFSLKDDIEVKFSCQVDFYPPHGAVRLIVESIDPVYTLGKIAQQRQKLIAELKEKGVLDKNKEIPLPLVPLNIGLITAFDSAAYNDFISELQRSGFSFRVAHVDTTMQGKKTEGDVCRALDILNSRDDLDVIVITRGGGSIAELSCFDSRRIAERIAKSRLPVLSGIGHEINTTVTDLAANRYEKTPTAIAQFLVGSVAGFRGHLDNVAEQIIQYAADQFQQENSHLRQNALALQTGTVSFLRSHHQMVDRNLDFFKKQPQKILALISANIEEYKVNLVKGIRTQVSNLKNRLQGYEKMVAIADPAGILKRGFSITRNAQGKAIREISQVGIDEVVETELSDGYVVSHVRQLDQSKKRKGGH